MGCTTQVVEHGPPALAALRAATCDLQGGDPLAAVTVVVPSNSAGVAARRWLAANGGIAAAQFVTVYRLAELLGAPALVGAGRRPVSTPVVDVAVRHALARAPGLFAPVAHHHATVGTLREVHRELRHVPAAALGRLAAEGSGRTAEVVRLHRAIAAELADGWYDEADLLASALASLPDRPPPVVVHLPNRLRPTEEHLLAALAERTDVRILHAGDTFTCRGTVEVVDTSDADEEVREVVRRIVAAADAGVPLERIAVVWPVADPYARLVTEHLDAAGIAWNGRPGIALHERLAARTVLDVLQIDRHGLRRADLFDVLAHVPARRPDGGRVPVARWERISRSAGLASGTDWNTRLAHFERERRATGRAHDADAAAALGAFVDDLGARLGPPGRAAPWRHWAAVATDLLDRWLGGPRRIAELPAAEHEAYTQVEAAVARLGQLDEIDAPVTRGVFVDALAAELDSTPGRVGRIGDGVQVGPLSFAAGQVLDHVYVLGATDGQLPSTPRPDPLLGDADRALAGGALAVSDDHATEQRRQFAAAVAAGGHCVVLRPRGDLRTTADRQPSRWIAELATATALVEHAVPSFAAGLSEAPFPAVACHHRVRALVHHRRRGEPIDTHPLVQAPGALRRGLAMVRARESAAFTAYDGDLAGLDIPSPLARTISPSALELWVGCPYAYFVRHLLGVQPIEEPDAALRIRALDLGNLLHDALDRFHRRVIAGDLPQPGPDGWGPEHLDAVQAELDAAGARMEAAGRVGRPAMWAASRAVLANEVRRWLAADGARLAERRATVIASEERFGQDWDDASRPAVALALPGGRTARLGGTVDRVDRGDDGTLYVIDHKSGSSSSYGRIDDTDPLADGRRLQLPIYAAAALTMVPDGEPTPAVHAEYSFLREGKRIGAWFPPDAWARVGAAIGQIVDGIAAGLFFPIPARSQHLMPWVECEYCDPDHLGTAERYEEHVRKRTDPRLATFFADDAPAAADTTGSEAIDG
ncbi:MAG: PD-(D/E)XK nuclease family protein [Ilumatobacteraceae bacterium]